jgi:hypothetical protein
MPVVNRIAAYAEEMQGWRRHLHAHPELAFDCHRDGGFRRRTAAGVRGRRVHEGIAKTGIVAIIEGQGGAGDRPARRYGRAADHGGDGGGTCLHHPRQDACLRP